MTPLSDFPAHDPRWNPWFGSSIVVIPTQGLGNRLRMMADAWVLARLWNLALEVLWPPATDCNCEATDLFAPEAFTWVREAEMAGRSYLFRGAELHTHSLLHELLQQTTAGGSSTEAKPWDHLVLQGGHEFIHPFLAVSDFKALKSTFYRSLAWSAPVREAVSAYQRAFCPEGRPYVAVHFRGFDPVFDSPDADHAEAVAPFNPARFSVNSPLPEFIRTLADLFQPSSPFVDHDLLVVTNQAGVHDAIRQALPASVQLLPPVPLAQASAPNGQPPQTEGDSLTRSRATRNDQMQAAIEFRLLAHAAVIVGSFHSSFSDEASCVGGVPKVCPLSPLLRTDLEACDDPTLQLRYHCIGFERRCIPGAHDSYYGLHLNTLPALA